MSLFNFSTTSISHHTTSPLYTGVIKTITRDKRGDQIGFIRPDEKGPDVFFSFDVVIRGFTPKVGARVEYTMVGRDGRTRANAIAAEGTSAAACAAAEAAEKKRKEEEVARAARKARVKAIIDSLPRPRRGEHPLVRSEASWRLEAAAYDLDEDLDAAIAAIPMDDLRAAAEAAETEYWHQAWKDAEGYTDAYPVGSETFPPRRRECPTGRTHLYLGARNIVRLLGNQARPIALLWDINHGYEFVDLTPDSPIGRGGVVVTYWGGDTDENDEYGAGHLVTKPVAFEEVIQELPSAPVIPDIVDVGEVRDLAEIAAREAMYAEIRREFAPAPDAPAPAPVKLPVGPTAPDAAFEADAVEAFRNVARRKVKTFQEVQAQFPGWASSAGLVGISLEKFVAAYREARAEARAKKAAK